MQRIVENVAATRDISPSELSTPLYEAVDPDALGRIQQSSDEPSLQVQFPYEGCVVTIDGAGTITVDRPQSDSGSTALPSELALEGASLSSGDEDTE